MLKSILMCASLISTAVLADVGDNWPVKSEIEKAPVQPVALKSNPKICNKVSKEQFLNSVNLDEHKVEKYRGYLYKVVTQVDLDLDGECEIIAYQRNTCGKWCSNEAYRLRSDNTYENLGNMPYFPLPENSPMSENYLEKHNGFIQLVGKSYTGGTYYFHFYRYEKGGYKLWRSDMFREDYKDDNKTKYIRTYIK